jgi:hypothetical protein
VRAIARSVALLVAASGALSLATLAGCGGRRSRPGAPAEQAVEMTSYSGAPPAARVAPSRAASAAADVAAADGRGLAAAGVAGGGTPSATPAADTAAGGTAAPGAAAAAMLIRTGTASVEVDSLEPAVARVRALAARVGGYVANATLAAGREQVRSASLELRVPAARFDEVVGGLAPFGRVERVDVRAEDVGEEFVDVTARAANGRRLEARLVELLARRTGKLEEVLAVERELARVREEVERHDGRLRYLRTRAATSTLSVTVHERAPLIAARPDAAPMADAFRAAARNFVALLAGVIATSGVWAPLGAAAYAAWRWRRRRGGAAAARPAVPRASPAA